ncbi:hypothetical protein F5887DRAFT_1083258 [Amanita rubescens]|nr:hypothetical protein F5887DRAFT_1083258 [Amanita rubescens]
MSEMSGSPTLEGGIEAENNGGHGNGSSVPSTSYSLDTITNLGGEHTTGLSLENDDGYDADTEDNGIDASCFGDQYTTSAEHDDGYDADEEDNANSSGQYDSLINQVERDDEGYDADDENARDGL